jgi:VWFA-related protein
MPLNALTFTRRPASIAEYLRSHAWERSSDFPDLDDRDRMYAACYGLQSPTAQEMTNRRHERMVLSALRGLVGHLQGLREERKAILLVTEGWTLFTPSAIGGNQVVAPPRIGIDRGKPVLGDPHDTVPREECERDRLILSHIDDEREFREMLQIANRSNATFYPVDPSGLEAPPTAAGWDVIKRRQDPLRSLAAGTDGIAIVDANDLGSSLKRVSDDLSSYYLLGYTSTNTKTDGKFRAITVRVKRPGVTVRARRGYLAMTEAEVKANEEATAPPPVRDPDAIALDDALAALDRGRPDRVILLRGGYTRPADVAIPWVVVELDASAARQPGWAQGGEVTASLVDPDGRPFGSSTARLSPSARSCLMRFGESPVPPGDYFARVKAQWSVLVTTEQVRIRVPDVAASPPLAFGPPVVFRRGPFTGQGFQPTADVVFRRAERVRIDAQVAAGVQSVAARLLDRKGQALPVPVSAALRRDPGGRFATAELPLAPMAVGDYVIELSLKAGGRTEKLLHAVRIVP